MKMIKKIRYACMLGLLPMLLACQAQVPQADALAKPALILVGDSTMAPGSGYGNALCARFNVEVSCLNLAKGGRSSGSYRAEGSWQQVMQQLRLVPDPANTLVLMQFGHNDQPGKPGRSTDLHTEFPRNLQAYIRDVRSTGAAIILVTPLTRRSFKDGSLPNDLRPWAESAIAVAQEASVALIDLNQQSHAMVEKMGQTQADTLAMAPPPEQPVPYPALSSQTATEPQGKPKSAFDRTHLGPKGADLFAGLVLQNLLRLRPQLQPQLRPQPVQGDQP